MIDLSHSDAMAWVLPVFPFYYRKKLKHREGKYFVTQAVRSKIHTKQLSSIFMTLPVILHTGCILEYLESFLKMLMPSGGWGETLPETN